MNPGHLIEKAAQAIITSATPGITLAEMHPEDRANVLLDARAALEAVAADIWGQGYEAGKEDAFLRAFGHKPIPNPYRASEET